MQISWTGHGDYGTRNHGKAFLTLVKGRTYWGFGVYKSSRWRGWEARASCERQNTYSPIKEREKEKVKHADIDEGQNNKISSKENLKEELQASMAMC